MVKRKLMFIFNEDLVKEPVIHNLGQQFDLITNIRRADIVNDRGWIILEIEGKEANIEQGIAWATSRGIRIDPAEDITEDRN